MSKSQNIYDNKTFFAGYQALRKRDDNHNILIEQPSMAALLPDLTDKKVLDLGCGCGENCIDFVRRGADRVVGVDISAHMLECAQEHSYDPKIVYLKMDICSLGEMEHTECFDLIYSSLVFHYVEDFDRLCSDMYAHLKSGGILLFSQEHPLNTAEGYFNKSEDGTVISYTVFDYNRPGKRITHWFIDGVEKYHRPIGQILTSLARAGFLIEVVEEPVPQPWALAKRPALIKEWTKPCFLIIRARKA